MLVIPCRFLPMPRHGSEELYEIFHVLTHHPQLSPPGYICQTSKDVMGWDVFDIRSRELVGRFFWAVPHHTVNTDAVNIAQWSENISFSPSRDSVHFWATYEDWLWSAITESVENCKTNKSIKGGRNYQLDRE